MPYSNGFYEILGIENEEENFRQHALQKHSGKQWYTYLSLAMFITRNTLLRISSECYYAHTLK